MRSYAIAAGVLLTFVLSLYGCGGGGGGGGPSVTVTKLYLFGTLSSNRNVANVTTSIAVLGFTGYSSPTGATSGSYPLRSGTFIASGPVAASAVSSSYDIASKKLTFSLTNGLFKNMSSSTLSNGGKGTEIGTLTTAPNVTFSAGTTDFNPSVGQFRLTPPTSEILNGCKVNYAP